MAFAVSNYSVAYEENQSIFRPSSYGEEYLVGYYHSLKFFVLCDSSDKFFDSNRSLYS